MPTLLPINVALTLRHLLQHQPWHSTAASELADVADPLKPPNENCEAPKRKVAVAKVILSCPQLGTSYAKVQSSVDRFFAVLRKE